MYNEGYASVDPEFVLVRPSVDAMAIQSNFGDMKYGCSIGLDFGGGNGRTASLLRRVGGRFDCFDPFGANELQSERMGKYNLCTAFEVFEHVTDPVSSLGVIVDKTSDGP